MDLKEQIVDDISNNSIILYMGCEILLIWVLRQLKQKRIVRIFYQQHFHRAQVFLHLPKKNPRLSLQKS